MSEQDGRERHESTPLEVPGLLQAGEFTVEARVGMVYRPNPDGSADTGYCAVVFFSAFASEDDAKLFLDKLDAPLTTYIENTYAKRQS